MVWASGLGGTYARTTDGGETWISAQVPGAETLQFRDVEGVSDQVAYLLSAGVGTDSRIYKTEDGGATWTLQFQNTDPNGFYDCFAFWTPTRGLTMADSVNGRFPVLRTLDGETWQDIGDKLPPALPAASSRSRRAGRASRPSARSGHGSAREAPTEARILATTDQGQTWAAYETPIVHGTRSRGVFTVAFRNPSMGLSGEGSSRGRR